jgi:GntR family transcriptional repressor for pyruvate dehydrogenase complex
MRDFTGGEYHDILPNMANRTLTLPPIADTDKIQQIVKVLQDFIIEGNLKHGTELEPERVLAARLGVSRFSLREALRVAQAQGLIEIVRGRRPRVALMSGDAAAKMIALVLRRTRKTLLDLIAARQGLETQIARLAAMNARESHVIALEKTIEALERNRENPEACVNEDIRFHDILIQATGNVVFEVMLAPLSELLRESRKETIRKGIERVVVGHRAILAAVRRGDHEKAASAMFQHLKMAEEDLRNIIGSSRKQVPRSRRRHGHEAKTRARGAKPPA